MPRDESTLEAAPDRFGVIRGAEAVLRRGTLPLLLLVGVVTTVPGNWLRVQNVDPQFSMLLVQRTMHFGGTFYDNAIQDHGPIEPFLYDLAARVGGRDGVWYGISALVTAASIALGYVAARVARSAGATREIGMAVGAAVFVHLTISRSNYAGVLYIRNITVVLLAAAWLLTIEDRVWVSARRRRVAAIAIGFLLGLAVQSLLSTFAAGAIGVVALATMWARVELRERLPLAAALAGSALATLVSAPVYYAIRGDFTEFWSGWVRYGHFMAVGPGRSTMSQLHLGWSTFIKYYEHRPAAWAVILAFGVTVGVVWRTLDTRGRIVHIGLFAWWVAAWFELALSQRYSAEYFVISTIPTAFMAAMLAGHVWKELLARRVPVRALVVLPLATALVAVGLASMTNFDNDVRAAWRFRGANANQAQFDKNRSGPERTALAVLDLVSHDDDPLLVWTNDPFPYLNLKRVSATRFFYKRFLLGEIYLGRTSTAYVLPDTWRWFAQDLRQSNPVAYMKVNLPDGPTGNPFASYVARDFRPVFTDRSMPVWLRNSAAREVLDPSATRRWTGSVPTATATGWKIRGSTATYAQGPVSNENDQLTISPDSCFRLDGAVTANAAGGLGHVEFRFDDNAGRNEQLNLAFEGPIARSSSDFVDFLKKPTKIPTGTTRAPFSLVVGRRSAALVVGGQVRAALVLPRSVTVTAQAEGTALTLSRLRVGAAPAGSGC